MLLHKSNSKLDQFKIIIIRRFFFKREENLASKPDPIYYYKYNIGLGELRRLLSSFIDIYRRKKVSIVVFI